MSHCLICQAVLTPLVSRKYLKEARPGQDSSEFVVAAGRRATPARANEEICGPFVRGPRCPESTPLTRTAGN